MPHINDWANCYDCPIRTKLRTTICPFLESKIQGMKRSVIVASKNIPALQPDCPFINVSLSDCLSLGDRLVAKKAVPCMIQPGEIDYEKDEKCTVTKIDSNKELVTIKGKRTEASFALNKNYKFDYRLNYIWDWFIND